VRTEKQEAFIEAFCLTGNAAKAAEMAGYSSKAAKQKGYALKKQFTHEISEKTRDMMRDAVPGVLAKLHELIEESSSDAVKLGAIKDFLDRAGLKPVEKVEQQVSHVEATSTEELRRELEALVGTSDPEEIPQLVN
jgi:hypothetical protein|tara:strand:+ start:369 stop:776 length:408 start_codon:yes stop_codon:yes gene_type:complete